MDKEKDNKQKKEYISITDLAGNTSKVSVDLNPIDRTLPIITGVIDGEKYNEPITYGIIEDNTDYIMIDGEKYTLKKAPRIISKEGTHNITVVDKSGNRTEVNFTIDKTPAKATVTYEPLDDKTEDVKVVMKTDEEIKTPKGWKKENKTTYSKVVGENRKQKRWKILSTVIGIFIAVLVLVTTDILLVTQFNVGPFLAVRTKVHNDGGSKEYYGLGYKVIKYNQNEGRKDTKVGFWTMPFTNTPTVISTMDFALNFVNNTKGTYNKYYGQYISLTDTIYSIDNDLKTITFQYHDEDGKYTFEFVAELYDTSLDITKRPGEKVEIVGTVLDYKEKTNSLPNRIIIKNAFIK